MSDHNLKILYISGPSFLDMDLSFVSSLSQIADCYYLLDVYPKLRKATALDLERASAKCDLIPMSSYPGFEIYSSMIDSHKSFVINRISDHPLAPSNLLMQFKLFQFLQKLKPDIIHFNNEIYFNHYYLFTSRSRILVSIHDPFPHSGEVQCAMRTSARLNRLLNRLFIRDHLLYNNIMAEDYAKDRNIVLDRIHTSSLGPYDFFALCNSASENEKCDFLFFGRIKQYKGLDILLDAFVKLLKQYPHATLTVAGSGSFGFELSSYSIPENNLRIINRFVPADELAGLIRSCKIVVCPYRDATQSGVVMTAYAFHKSVIVTDVGALPNVVEDGLTGYVIKANDTESLVDAMAKVMSGQLSQDTSYQHIENIYHKGEKSWSTIANNTLAIYRKILSS